MQTKEFDEQIEILVNLTRMEKVVLMCAEGLPWRCHRCLIADALLLRNVRVEYILIHAKRRLHTLTPFARVDGIAITYPPSEGNEESSRQSKESVPNEVK